MDRFSTELVWFLHQSYQRTAHRSHFRCKAGVHLIERYCTGCEWEGEMRREATIEYQTSIPTISQPPPAGKYRNIGIQAAFRHGVIETPPISRSTESMGGARSVCSGSVST